MFEGRYYCQVVDRLIYHQDVDFAEQFELEIADLEFRYEFPHDRLTRDVAELEYWAINEADPKEAGALLRNRINYENAEHIGIADECLEAKAAELVFLSREEI